MDKLFRIGDFTFRLCAPKEITPPENFMKFEIRPEDTGSLPVPEYTYHIEVSERLKEPEGKIVARRPDLLVFQQKAEGNGQMLESRLIGVKGRPDPYACYREVASDRAEILLMRDEIQDLHIDPLFTSLLALERRLVWKDQMVLHCAYVEYQREAILFFRAIGDGQDHPGKSMGKVSWEPDGQRRPFPSGEDRRQMDGSGMAGLRHFGGLP